MLTTQVTRNIIAILVVIGGFIFAILYPDRYTIKDFLSQLVPFLSGWLLMDRPGKLQEKIEVADEKSEKKHEE